VKTENAIRSLKKSGISRLVIQENIWGWVFLCANLIGYGLFKMLPILFSFVLSFCDWNLVSGLDGIKFVGLENYTSLFSDAWFIRSLINTLLFAVLNVPIAVCLSLILAVIINNMIFFKQVIRLFYYLPYISSVVAVSLIWGILYLPDFGPINEFLRSLGISNPPKWLSSPDWALISIVIMSVWQVLGYYAVLLLAGLQTIPDSLYESADIDGANFPQKFFKITLPMLAPTMFFVIVIAIINSFQVFTQVNVMTQGGPGMSTTVLVYYIYKSAFNYNKIGYANAIGWVLFLMVFAFTAIQWKFAKKDSYIN
jgi:multiple sugar transport system permease protein